MKKTILTTLLAGALVVPAYAVDLSGVNVPEKLVVGESALVLNGAGIRKKMMFEVYVASLYGVSKTTEAVAILNAATPRRLQLTMLRTVDAVSLYQALLEGLQGNVPAEQLKLMGPKVAELERMFNEMKSANKGDVIVLDFLPGQGSRVSARGRALGVIEGDVFASALLSIWLGKSPVSEDLKRNLLGKG